MMCKDCGHWLLGNIGGGVGECHRFPKAEETHERNYCGEYVERRKVTDLREVIPAVGNLKESK